MSRTPAGGVAHWDEAERERADSDPIMGTWRDLGTVAGSVRVGMCRAEVDPGKHSTPAHRHGAEEEIVFVLGGSGFSWQDGRVYGVRPADTLVHRPEEEVHTLVAGPGGLDVLVFGQRIFAEATHLPRAGIVRVQETWVADAGGAHPYEREAAAGPLDVSRPQAGRPPTIVALQDVAPQAEQRPGYEGSERDLGRAAGSVATGLRHLVLSPGALSCPPHWHSGEEELFVVLAGDGALLLHDQLGAVTSETALRAGHVVSRPAGTGVAHALRAGGGGMTYLAYGTREPNEVVYYPRSRKARLGQLMVRVEPVEDYWDGEP